MDAHNLKQSTLTKRLQAADYALEQIDNGTLKNLRRLLFEGSFHVQSFADAEMFSKDINADKSVEKLLSHTVQTAYVKPVMNDNGVQFHLFHDETLSAESAKLCAATFRAVIAVTYAALGLDMTGIAPIDSQSEESRE